MRFPIASLIASLLLLSLCGQAQAGWLLEKKYNITGPEYHYDSWQFTMDFEVSDFMKDSMIQYRLYDGMNCRDGGDNDITENEGYLLSRIRTDNTPIGDGTGERKVKIESKIVSSKMVGSEIYSEDEEGNGIVEYCIRFSVYNVDRSDRHAMEVNFLEIPIRLTIDLNADFGVKPQLEQLDLLTTLAQEGVAVEAYLCDRDDNIVPLLPTMQGQTVRVCVSPTPKVMAAGFRMRQLEQFTFRREIPISTRQDAIDAGTGGVPANELTVVSCRPGSMVCAFETMLVADFFTSEGVISGNGMTFLQIGGDDSVAARRLQGRKEITEKPLGFDLAIELVPLDRYVGMDEVDSSAPTTTRFPSPFALAVQLAALGWALSTIGFIGFC